MTNELLASLGITPDLPAQRVLELLQDKNLEYLERLDACTDPARIEELKQKQQEIEAAILTCSTGLTLDRRIRERAQAPSEPSATAPTPNEPQISRLDAALLDYQAGNHDKALPVLWEFAEQGDTLACVLAANLLNQKGQSRDARSCLFTAAQQGDATATLMLAQQYFQEENYISAKEWGEKALKQQTPGSGKLRSQIAVKENRLLDGVKPLLSELDWASGYDRYTLTREICALLDAAMQPHETLSPYIKELLIRLKEDKRCTILVQTHIWQEDNSVKNNTITKVGGILTSIIVTGILHSINTALVGPLFDNHDNLLPFLFRAMVLGYIFIALCGIITHLAFRVYGTINHSYHPKRKANLGFLFLLPLICVPLGFFILIFSGWSMESPLGALGIVISLLSGLYGAGMLGWLEDVCCFRDT